MSHVSRVFCDLTLSMLRLLSSKAQRHKDFQKPSKPCHVGIHWIALTAYFQMSTHLPGFQSFFRVFASVCMSKISHHQQGLTLMVVVANLAITK